MEKVKKNPPGKRWFKKLSNTSKWLIFSVAGLLLIGAGICVIVEASHLKQANTEPNRWILMGTYGLILFNSGLSIFGQATVFKSKIEFKKMLKKQEEKLPNISLKHSLKPTKLKNPED